MKKRKKETEEEKERDRGRERADMAHVMITICFMKERKEKHPRQQS